MVKLFELILQNSFVGILFILVILTIRLLTKNLSKIYVNILWLLLLLELIIITPFVASPFQTLRNISILTLKEEVYDNYDKLEHKEENYHNFATWTQKEEAVAIHDNNVKSSLEDQKTKLDNANSVENKISPKNATSLTKQANRYGLIDYLCLIWILGMTISTVVFLTQYFRIRRKLKTAVKVEEYVWETDAFHTPFVMPGIPAKIYIPFGLEGRQREDILAHERQHIKHFDPWIKLIATLALIVHWFNPFVWIAYSFIGKDIEMFCDERVLKGKSFEEKKKYSQTILDFAKKSSGISFMMSFAENNAENRIKHILNSKKPRLIMRIVLIAIILFCGVLFLTTAKSKETERTFNENGLDEMQREENIEEAETDNGINVQTEEESTDNSLADYTTEANQEPENENQNRENGNEEEEYWGDKLIVGTTFEPDPDLRNRIEKAPSYIDSWWDLPLVTEDIIGTPQEEEIYKAVNLIGETQSFSLYGTSYLGSMIIKTSDNGYVFADIPFTSNYLTQPLLNEMDYDQDGESELAIIIYVLHGTGVSIKTLFMIDKAGDGTWNMYQLLESEYLPQIEANFDTVYVDNSIKLLFKGEYVGPTLPMDELEGRNSSYKFYAGMQTQIRFIEDRIVLSTDLGGFSDTIITGDYIGHRINADIIYLGEGKWGLQNFRYSNASIDSQIERALTLYFTGNIRELNQYYMVDGSQLKEISERSHDVTILDISYPNDNLDSGEVEAYVAVRVDKSDSLFYVTMTMKLVDPLFDTWKIEDLITEK